MGLPNIELYEALKKTPVGEEAARMIAAVVPAGENVATKLDVAAVRTDFGALRTDFEALRTDFTRVEKQMLEMKIELKEEIHASSIRSFRWMLTFFIPVWAGTWGTVVAVLLKG